MRDLIDLHVHSSCSDGSFTPTELVQLAHKKGMRAFALTDHDTMDGVAEAIAVGLQMQPPLEVIPGIELSTAYQKKDIHIVGLRINHHDAHFQEELTRIQVARDGRNAKIISNLQKEGIDITEELMYAAFGDAVWTRAHLGRFLLNNGYVSDIKDAFSRYIGDDAPCFVPKEELSPHRAIQMIHESGGIAILAHPLLYNFTLGELETLIESLKKSGLDGMEVMYSNNRQGDEQRMKLLTVKYDLGVSGGSDFHGSNKPTIDLGTGKGNLNMSYDIWKSLNGK